LADDNKQTAKNTPIEVMTINRCAINSFMKWTRQMGTFWSQCRQSN